MAQILRGEAPADAFAPTYDAIVAAERPAVAAALCALYDHLTHHEQWRAAAILLAYCTPAFLLSDPAVVDLLRHAVQGAKGLEDATTERAHALAADVVRIADDVLVTLRLPARARFWTAVARMRGARSVLEWGTEHGAHVLLAAHLWPDARWIGVDARPAQVAANQEQAARLQVPAEFYTDDDPVVASVADVVGLLDALEHTAYPEELLDRTERCCRPGGVVVVTMPHGALAPHDVGTPAPGSHVAVDHTTRLAARLSTRGRLLYAQTLAVDPAERQVGREGAAVIYAPGSSTASP